MSFEPVAETEGVRSHTMVPSLPAKAAIRPSELTVIQRIEPLQYRQLTRTV